MKSDYFWLKSLYDPEYFCTEGLGLDLGKHHKEWLKLVLKYKKICIEAFRGSGKTTIFGVAIPIWLCCIKPKTQVMIVSNAFEQATRTLEIIKNYLTEKELLQDFVPKNRELTWTKTEIDLTNKSKIFCKALTPNIRGVHVNYAFCDEAGEYTDHDLFHKAIKPIVNVKKGTLVVVGTPKTPGDLLEELSKTPGWFYKKYPPLDKNGEPVWPQKYPKDYLEKIRIESGEATWKQEYLCDRLAPRESTIFPMEHILQCVDYAMKFSAEDLGGVRYMGCDFATATGYRADYDVYIIVERVGEQIVIKHAERHKGMPLHAKVERIRDLFNLHKPRLVLLDESGIGKAVGQELLNLGIPTEMCAFGQKMRKEYLINLVGLIHDHKLVIPMHPQDDATYTFSKVLIEELHSFRETKTKLGTVTYHSEAPHDDTVMALALACWGASNKHIADIIVATDLDFKPKKQDNLQPQGRLIKSLDELKHSISPARMFNSMREINKFGWRKKPHHESEVIDLEIL